MSAGPQGRPEEDGGGNVLGPLVVTDAELAVLEAAYGRLVGDRQALVLCRAEGRNDPTQDEALRSLVARGLLGETGELSEDDDVGLLLATVLGMRVASSSVLVVDRLIGSGADPGADPVGAVPAGTAADSVRHGVRLVHLWDSGACVEDLLPDGAHHLYLALDAEDVVRAVTDVTVPPDAVAGWGRSRAVAADRPEDLVVGLGHPTVLADLTVLKGLDAEQDPRLRDSVEAAISQHHIVALGASGCWVSDLARAGSVPGALVFAPVHPSWVERWVRSAQQGGEVEAARPLVVGEQGTMSG